MNVFFAVGLGGIVGASGRYGISILFHNTQGFPYPTLIVNLIGCFLLSFLMNQPVLRQKLPQNLFTALTTGLIGSFTTFSTLTVEIIQLWSTNIVMAISYTFLTIFGGLAFCLLGFTFASRKQANS